VEVEIRDLSVEDLDELTTIHGKGFPDSAMSKLGTEVVRRYYDWLLNGPHDASTFGLFRHGELLGFCFCGKFNGAVSGFVKRNRLFLFSRVITRPDLWFSSEFLKRIRTGARALFRIRGKPEVREERVVMPPSFGILAIAVSPKCQGEGFGKKLMEVAENVATNRGFTRMNLSVSVTNLQAITFYENLGWDRRLEDGVWKGQMTKSPIRGTQ
jgi:ribosomal protein S18 acetylase RimI-like enzyme